MTARESESNKHPSKSKYSIRDYDNITVAWIDTDITKQKPKDISMEKYVQKYISSLIMNNGDFLATLPNNGK